MLVWDERIPIERVKETRSVLALHDSCLLEVLGWGNHRG